MKFITLERIDEYRYGYDEISRSTIVECKELTPVIINPDHIIYMTEYFLDDEPECLDYTLVKLTDDVKIKAKHKIKEIIEMINKTEEDNKCQNHI